MNSLEIVNKMYKPYRITKKGACTIIESTEGKYVIKEKREKNIKELQNYLLSRGFNNFPKVIDFSRSDIDIYEYLEDINYPKEQKAEDMIKVIANLHSKTVYTKEVREDKYKEIFDTIDNNLKFYKNKYEELIQKIENERFMRPSHYMFIRNSSKLLNQIEFCEKELTKWYDEVKDKRDTRVSIIHNNLSLEHFIRNKDEYLISWNNYIKDNPILDIYTLYQKEIFNVEFGSILKEYLKRFPLEKEELNLLLILLCMPKDIEFTDDEFESCKKVSTFLDYVFKTESLVRPYYTIENIE